MSNPPKILGVIPARFHSTRLPRKMLQNILGKPLIHYTWRQAKKAKILDQVIVATDNREIYDAVKKFGGIPVMTSKNHKSGSDRIAEAAKIFKNDAQIIVNIQGDEPLLSPQSINAAVQELIKNPKAVMATIAVPFKDKDDVNDPSCVKVVLDKNNYALYFSRSKIPYDRNPYENYLKHLGLYAFRRDFLFKYIKFGRSLLEFAEGLEQLRVLEKGYKIKVAIGNFESIGVDTAADLAKVRKIISQHGKK